MTPLFPVPFLFQAASSSGSLSSFAPLIFQFGAIFAIFYFLMIRPQQKQRKEHEAAILSLKKGDEVVTAGGLVGEVLHIRESLKDGQSVRTLDDRVTLKTGESKVIVERGRIAKVMTAAGGNDAK